MPNKRNTLLLKSAAGIYLFFSLAHTAGALFHQGQGAGENAVVATMKGYHFDAMGMNRTLWDFFFGYGLLLTVLLLVLTTLSWYAAWLTRSDPQQARPLIGILFVASLAVTVLSWAYFFTAPGVSATLATLLLGVALARR